MSAPTPVSYSDIGKAASDLFSKDFPLDLKLEVKNLASNNVVYQTTYGELKTKYVYPKRGVTLTQTWTTTNNLIAQIELDNSLSKGLKLDLQSSLQPSSGDKNIKGGLIFKQPGLHSKAYFDMDKGPIFQADTVIGKEGFLVGGDASYDVADGKISRYGIAAGYVAPDYSITLRATNLLSTYTLLYFHRVQSDIEAGAKAVLDDSGVKMELGTRYILDKHSFVKAKIDNSGCLGLGYTQELRPGIKLSLGGHIDATLIMLFEDYYGLSTASSVRQAKARTLAAAASPSTITTTKGEIESIG
ncbi:16811_t:CDS:2 [Entrophospora sp. SA101]|nr:6180_t:CDS:2 [Entrophospora sp. SA101]CAJ0758660.1 16811_t:CDS:2 [Entrophospora sp. SA101]CAJ0832277.1 124_t:CDS:2 [Entrophospora sp. SA101]CAJ0895489.1 2639_t:CDS:2 [Entrophospora sp. SA101]